MAAWLADDGPDALRGAPAPVARPEPVSRPSSSDQARRIGVTGRYWERKESELGFLRSFLGAARSAPPVSSLSEYYEAVRDLRLQMRAHQAAASADLFETSLRGWHTYERSFGEVSYSYQRYDLAVTGMDWLSSLYGERRETRPVGGLFFSSGMSAIGAALLVMSGAGCRRISIGPMAYFETHLLCRRFFPHLEIETNQSRLSSDAHVLWLDTSSTQDPELPASSRTARYLVVDTTCVEGDSPLVDGWLRESERLGCVLLLIRSHLKLDTFGLELGKLGSIVVVGPDHDDRDIEQLLLGLRRACSGFGLGFELPHLYPWLGTPEFFELSRLRTEGIRMTTEAVACEVDAARLAGDEFEVILPEHRLFFLIRTGIPFRDEEAAKQADLPRAIASRCARAGLPVFAGSSFGLDRLALLDFVNIHDGLHYLRVSGADVPLEESVHLGRFIRDGVCQR
jgi:hypothetical protein